MDIAKSQISDEKFCQVRLLANGWLYKVESEYQFSENVPPNAILGAWRLDSNGEIIGDFISNPNYKKMGKGDSPEWHKVNPKPL